MLKIGSQMIKGHLFLKTLNKLPELHTQQFAGMARLSVTPLSALMDDKVDISVEGLKPHQKVTLASCMEEEGVAFVAHGHYEADTDGQVHVGLAVSGGGSYQGIEPMGLFWSLTPAKGLSPGLRLRKKDITTPHLMTLSVLANHVTADTKEVQTSADLITSQEIQRWYMGPGVKRIPVHEGRLRGMLFVPNDGQGQHPGVIDMYGTTGGLAQYRAALLASRGFTTLALAYFAYDDLPKTMDLEMEYFEEAVDWFSSHDNVSPHGIGTIGLSKGAEMAIWMAILRKQVKAVVAISSYSYLSTANHTYQGKELPRVFPEIDKAVEGKDGVSFGPAFEAATNKEEAVLQLEKAPHAQFLFLNGTEDQLCDPKNLVRNIHRLQSHGMNNYEAHLYHEASHLLEPPYMPFCPYSWHKFFAFFNVYGGDMRAHASAQSDTWTKLQQFFKKHLGLIAKPMQSKI